jgi:hypothetical protein
MPHTVDSASQYEAELKVHVRIMARLDFYLE